MTESTRQRAIEDVAELPTEISRASFELAPGLTIETIVLDNGERLITEESMEAFLNWLQDGNTIDAELKAKLEGK